MKIVLLGNPLPVVGNPLRLAEELAMIDMISKGRLVTGWVRGAGSEQFATNANPGFNREYFNEAHDLVVRAWTEPGPWRYEGKHFHYRFVDPWALPLQKPHPPIWIPGLLSPETVIWCAQHRYPYVALATFLEPTVELWNIYRDAAAKEGYQVGPENFGYLQKVYVAETDEKAREIAKYDMFGGAGIGYSLFGQPQWMFPPGYNSKEATRRIAKQFSDPANADQAFGGAFSAPTTNDNIAASQVEVRAGVWQQKGPAIDTAALRKQIFDAFPKVEKSLQVICGTPKTVLPKIRKVLEVLRPGVFGFWQNDGPISAKDRTTSMRLIATEVLPRGARDGARNSIYARPSSARRVSARCRRVAFRSRWARSKRSRHKVTSVSVEQRLPSPSRALLFLQYHRSGGDAVYNCGDGTTRQGGSDVRARDGVCDACADRLCCGASELPSELAVLLRRCPAALRCRVCHPVDAHRDVVTPRLR